MKYIENTTKSNTVQNKAPKNVIMRKDTLLRTDLYIYLICGLFFIKTLIFACVITPLWSIPDEIGHIAYAKELATQYQIPILGKAKIDTQLFTSFLGVKSKHYENNWIAQHSPIYYFLAAFYYKTGTLFTSDPEILFRMTRIASVIFGTLTRNGPRFLDN